MNGSEKKLQINHDMCIGCGNCINACTHKARTLIDDTDRFMEDLKQKKKIIAVAAPAVASFFPDQFLNLNGYLKSLGVEAFFDVSLGAELTVISYLDYIKEKNPRTVIAQPCPAIVTYIEINHPELLPFLAPADSPMLHTIKLVRKFYPKYKDHKIAVISPCIAKRREYDETGLGDYNVTMLALKNILEDQKIILSSFPQVEYTGVSAERAAGFPIPGGLLDTAERFKPGIRRITDKIEGVHNIYPYLKEISEMLNTKARLPLLIDCLNCEKGCIGGPGTGNAEKSLAMLREPVQRRMAELEEKQHFKIGNNAYRKYHNVLKKYWKKGLYNRSYRNLSENNTVKQPSETEITEIFHTMRKYRKEDIYNCTCCGYGSCKAMATAIYNNLNKHDNCAHYILALLKENQEHIANASTLIEGINNLIQELNATIVSQAKAVDNSSAETEEIIASIKETSEMSLKQQESVKGLIEIAGHGQDSMKKTIQSINDISQSVEGISSAIRIISSIAANTNLLSMNAAIEAAHAGDAGMGFAVVAGEIRRLSENTRENAVSISHTLKTIISGISDTTKQSGETDVRIAQRSDEIRGFAKTMSVFISTFSELSEKSEDITTSLVSLKEQSSAVKTSYAQMIEMTNKLSKALKDLSDLSKR
jgi:iron only hydrogenase large subunit-like protein/uncharacterized coiled-coil DUF342 family protein